MAALHVYLERENGERLASCGDLVGAAPFVRSKSEGTLCVRFIDAYGNTVFNRGQCGVLREEWLALVDGTPADLEPWVRCVSDLIERCANEIHLYLRFVGD